MKQGLLQRKLLTLEAVLRLCWMSLALRCLPVRYLLPSEEVDALPGDSADAAAARAVRGAIRSAIVRLPFTVTCLAQSLAAARMLVRRRVPHRIHIGATMERGFQAHAWVEAAGLIVAGEGETERYKVLLTRGSVEP